MQADVKDTLSAFAAACDVPDISREERDPMPSRTLRLAAVAVALAAVRAFVAGPSPLEAGIHNTHGSVLQLAPPPSVLEGDLENGAFASVFQESLLITLTSKLRVDVVGSGSVRSPDDLRFGSISAGTNVASYLLHQDRPGPHGSLALHGSIRFDAPILGVIVSSRRLNRTDGVLGNPATVYPTGLEPPRGLELRSGQDRIRISADMKTLYYRFRTWSSLDEIRVVTAASVVPTPGTGALLAMAGFVALGRRRRA
jgi:uncharacterized protein (TIGR03382 family)